MTQKTTMQIIWQTFEDFTEHTSIHGLKYVCQKNITVAERCFWALVTLIGVGLAVYMTTLFWSRYTSNPTRTTIMSFHAPTTALPFPALTLCNENIVIKSKVKEFIKTLKTNNISEEDIMNAFNQLHAFTDPRFATMNGEHRKLLNQILNANNYNIEGVMSMVGQKCKELLMRCQWNFKSMNCMEVFVESYSKSGMCCTFVGLHGVKHEKTYTEQYGTEGTLSIMIDPIVERNKLGFGGMKVLFHDAASYPDFRTLRKFINTGTQTHLQIKGTTIICSKGVMELPREERDCVFPGEVQLKYFKMYTDANCRIEKEADQIMQICGCVPYYFDFSMKPKCNIPQIPCLLDIIMKNYSQQDEDDNDCPVTCEDDLYEVKTTSIKLEQGNYHHLRLSDHFETLNNHETQLKIYFIGYQKVLRRDLTVSTLSLMASFGGIYSLFIGCSLLTVCEICYYCTLRFLVRKFILGRRVDPK